MKSFLMSFALFVGMACAQVATNQSSPTNKPDAPKPDAGQTGTAQPPDGTVLLCKLEGVNWNPETQELSWVISMRKVNAGPDEPEQRSSYTIHLDTAVMNSNGEGRRFDADQAQKVSQLMEVLNAYAVQSTVWWSQGLGEKVNGKEAAPSQKQDPLKKVDQPKAQPLLRGPAAALPVPVASNPVNSARP